VFFQANVVMDLREYEYIAKRQDTFPRSTLCSIREMLSKIQSDKVVLIDKTLSEGYIKPPRENKWHGCYKIILSENEKKSVLEDLIKVESILDENAALSENEKQSLKQYVVYWSRCIDETPEDYETYKSNQQYYDLRQVSFEGFHQFIFELKVAVKGEDDPWYWNFNLCIDYDEEQIANLYIELFENADCLLELYPKDMLEQGFWAIMGGNLENSAYSLIWDSDLSIEVKEKLISSMYFLYEKLFFEEPLDTSSEMWWDSLAFCYYEGGSRDPANNEEDRRIQNAMFITLKKILSLNSERCQSAALHGLGHLRHPENSEAITDYIKKNKNLTTDQIEYANACIAGDIM
jgi:hypothetical protein